MSEFLANLFRALCNRARSRSAVPRPRRTTLCILPLEDRITPSAVGGFLPAPSDPAASTLVGLTTTARLISFDSSTPRPVQGAVGGGGGDIVVFDIVDAVAPGSARSQQIIIGDVPDAADHATNSDVEWKYVPVRRTGLAASSDGPVMGKQTPALMLVNAIGQH